MQSNLNLTSSLVPLLMTEEPMTRRGDVDDRDDVFVSRALGTRQTCLPASCRSSATSSYTAASLFGASGSASSSTTTATRRFFSTDTCTVQQSSDVIGPLRTTCGSLVRATPEALTVGASATPAMVEALRSASQLYGELPDPMLSFEAVALLLSDLHGYRIDGLDNEDDEPHAFATFAVE